MMHLRMGSCALAAAVLAPAAAFAAGNHLHEQGTSLMGAAYAGQAAVAEDASTAYYNPAGMTQLDRPQLVIGTLVGEPTFEFENDGGSTVPGSNGGDASWPVAGATFFYMHPIGDDWRVGFSATAPFGLTLDYLDDWTGRYYVQDSRLITVNLNPSVAWRATDWLSVGAGVSAQYAKLDASFALNNVLDGLDDGNAVADLGGFGFGFNAGVLVTPRDGTRIGLAYRSQIAHSLDGELALRDVGPTLTALGIAGNNLDFDFTLPQSVTVSLVQALGGGFSLLADAAWMDWSALDRTISTFDTGAVDITERNWHDTWRVALGLRYQWSEALMLQTGIGFDSSPVKAQFRVPDLPADDQIRYAVGAVYTLSERFTVGLAYEYVDLSPGRMATTKNALTGTLSGDYDKDLHFLSASLAWRF
ncbi:MAG: outer membrane protein transport protein [Alphaproteobacteria bacterium]